MNLPLPFGGACGAALPGLRAFQTEPPVGVIALRSMDQAGHGLGRWVRRDPRPTERPRRGTIVRIALVGVRRRAR